RIGAPAFTSVSIAAASLMCLPFSLALAQSYTVDWSVGMVLSLLYLGVGCGWYAYWLWNKGMSRVPANVSGLLISLEPVVGVLLAVLILGEHLSPVSALGVFVVIAATLVAGRLSHQK
ncbi:TPA: DMT family transporter, partial [Neisseria meningitidis]